MDRSRIAALWREHVGAAPPADGAAGPRRSERAMRLRRLYDTPVAVVHGQWFFAHERLAQIEHRLDELGWRRRGDSVDYYFSFRSPYSYLSGPRAFALADEFDVEVVFRGVIPMAMRGQTVPVAKRLHTLRDVKREADRLGMPFGRVHDPIGDGALRCLLVAEHAADAGRVARVRAGRQPGDLGRGRRRRDATRGCGRCASAPGLDWDACAAALDDPAMRARVDANTERLGALGHWGVPGVRARRRALLGPGPHRGRGRRPERGQPRETAARYGAKSGARFSLNAGHALARPRRTPTNSSRLENASWPTPGEVLGVGVERLLDEPQRGGREREDLVGPAPHLGRAAPPAGTTALTRPQRSAVCGVVLAAEHPDLASALLAHDAGEVGGAEAGVERPDARPGLAEARRCRRRSSGRTGRGARGRRRSRSR